MPITSFNQLRDKARTMKPARLAVAGGNDPQVVQAVIEALDMQLVSRAIITGDASQITALVPAGCISKIRIVDAQDPAQCAIQAVAAVRAGQADILMKGHVDSTSYLRAIVARETGIRTGSVLSNITVAEMPSLPRLIAATDNGIIPAPDLEQKRQIILNTRALFHGLGIDTIRVAALAATEKVSSSMPATTDAAALRAQYDRGAFPGFIVDGPFGYDVAVSWDAARRKGLEASDVAGRADLLLFATIEAANAVVKSWKYHGQAKTGSIILGADVPVLLNSRSDNVERRIFGLLLATAQLGGPNR